MGTPSQEKQQLVDAVRRRLRLARLPWQSVGPGTGDEFDVRVVLSPPDDDLSDEILALCPDVRIQVLQGRWTRC